MKEHERVIVHLDIDAFYAACEEIRKPELRGRPVVIGADPKEGKGRGVVSTCNYKAREYGIKSGMPISWAYRRCPQAVFLPVDMPYYMEVSHHIMGIIKRYGEKFEQVSIDEAYLQIARNYGDAERIASKLKKEIKEREKLTCSIGVGSNKLIAKIASDFKKPDGLTVVKPYEVKMFLYPLAVDKLLGVGPKTTAALEAFKIKTIGDLAKFHLERLQKEFGKNLGQHLHLLSQGIYDDEIGEEREMKSVSRQATFEQDTKDRELISTALNEMLLECFVEVQRYNLKFRNITVKVRYEDFDTRTRQKSYKHALNRDESLSIAKNLLLYFLRDNRKVRLVGIALSGLSKGGKI